MKTGREKIDSDSSATATSSDGSYDLDSVFRTIASNLNNYEQREQQLDLARAINRSFTTGKTGVFEAGTGIGKSLAALVPAAISRKKVVVSTATISLQDQYISKDIPLLRQSLPFLISATVLKGRGNYVGLRRWQDYLKEQLVDDELSDWINHSPSGDIAELPFMPPYELWSEINSDSDDCLRNKCPKFNECFYFEAKKFAEKADIIVVNHALLLADAASHGAILPQYDLLIIDEAHHLHSIATEAFSVALSSQGIKRMTTRAVKRLSAPISLINEIEIDAAELFAKLNHELRYMKMRLRQPVPDAEALKHSLSELKSWLKEQTFDNLIDVDMAKEKALLKAKAVMSTVETYLTCLDLMLAPSDQWVTWAERRDSSGSRMGVIAAPLDVSGFLSDLLLRKSGLTSTVFMSATLATAGEDKFAYFKANSGITGPVVQDIFESPFDYKNKAVLYLPRNMPEPNSHDYLPAVASEIEKLVEISSGRAFALFTSKQALNTVYDMIAARLPFPSMRQGDMPRKGLLDWFKSTDNAVLFGTASFWEGVSVDGDTLSCVIIDRIPFQVPDDPVYEARCDAMKDDPEKNWFNDLALPHATTRLKQGVGRLIRTQEDSGMVAILDPRMTKKFYGRRVVQCLPPMRITQNPADLKSFFEGK